MIDIGANLAHDSFDQDRDIVLDRAINAGVDAIVLTGSCESSTRKAARIATTRPGFLYSTAGLHPHHAADWSPALRDLFREMSSRAEVVSLGECGLDYFRNFSSPSDQRKAFAGQLELASELKLPLFLHQRDAHPDFVAMLEEFRPQLAEICVHCFTDTAQAAEDYLELDCHIGITGWICDERRGQHLMDVVPRIPDSRLLVETDAPYLLPRTMPKAERPKDGRRNEPAYLPWVVKKIAEARGDTSEHVATVTANNARRFFDLN